MKHTDLYDVYEVELKFRNRLYGGVPKNPDALRSFLESSGLPKELEEEYEEEAGASEEVEKNHTGFREDENGIFIRDFQIKALLKETASVLGITTSKRGSKAILQHGLFVKPDRIYLLDEGGSPKKAPDGNEVMVGKVRGPSGTRSVVTIADYVEKAIIRFQIWLLKGGKFAEEDLYKCLLLGQEDGLGSRRSFEAGKYDIVRFAKVEDDPLANEIH